MDEIKRIPDLEFQQVLALHRFDQFKLTKDYFLTLLLYLIKDIDGIYFKGGTALNKTFLNHARLSEDIDFTLTKDISIIKKEIVDLINNSAVFEEITKDKNVD